MDCQTILDHLVRARRHVADGREHIAKQHVIIARLEAQGHDTAKARDSLRLFEEMQALHVADCERLEKALVDGAIVFSPGDDLRRVDGAHEVSRESMNELRWYQVKISETADVFRRSKDALDSSREMLLNLDDAPGKDAVR